jgi:hypothetical protein
MLGTGYSGRDDSLAEPLSGIQSLLIGRIHYPLLILQISYLGRYRFEPVCGFASVADSPPQLSYQVGQDCTFFPWNGVICPQCILEHPGGMTPEVTLGFDIAFIDAAPGSAKQ